MLLKSYKYYSLRLRKYLNIFIKITIIVVVGVLYILYPEREDEPRVILCKYLRGEQVRGPRHELARTHAHTSTHTRTLTLWRDPARGTLREGGLHTPSGPQVPKIPPPLITDSISPCLSVTVRNPRVKSKVDRLQV